MTTIFKDAEALAAQIKAHIEVWEDMEREEEAMDLKDREQLFAWGQLIEGQKVVEKRIRRGLKQLAKKLGLRLRGNSTEGIYGSQLRGLLRDMEERMEKAKKALEEVEWWDRAYYEEQPA